jgi:RNA polymerase sigma-70 factor (ECF subfamily)
MYAILIGMFVQGLGSYLVLACQTKTEKMNTDLKNPGTSYQTPHSDLIEKCRKGDHSAQFMIYKLYYKAMFNVSLRIVKDTMEAEDIMQESFLVAFEKINTFSGAVAFGAWLRKIVQNKSLDALKRTGRVTVTGLESVSSSAMLSETHDQGIEIIDVRYKRIRSIIEGLPEKYRNIISLHFLEGFDLCEISEIMSVPSNTVRSQLCRARKMVRSEYEALKCYQS